MNQQHILRYQLIPVHLQIVQKISKNKKNTAFLTRTNSVKNYCFYIAESTAFQYF